MICRPHVIGILFLFHTFVSDFLVFILNTIVHTFTLLLLKRRPNIKWTYQYFHLAMMFTFGTKEDEQLSTAFEYFCETLIMNVSNECITTPVYIIESFSNFTGVILTLFRHYKYQISLLHFI